MENIGIYIFFAISIIAILLVLIKIKSRRARIGILAGFGITVISFAIFFGLIFSVHRAILWLLLLVFYISTISFLILWNKTDSKKVYRVLSIPALCIISAAIIIGYANYTNNIPTVNEQSYLHRYMPFSEGNLLAKLNEESTLKIHDNLPILDGATALFPVYASFAQAVYPGFEPKIAKELVLCTGTIEAYEKLLMGKADLIFCAPPSDSQLRQFEEKGIKIKLTPIGREAFVFFVNKSNTVDSLTINDIQDIYSGKITNWKKLGGDNRSIRAFQRPDNSGSQTALKSIMGNTPIMNPRKENVPGGMGDIINQVAVYRNFTNAIGYSFLFYSTEMVKNDQIKLLSIEKIYPSIETIQNGSYPFSDVFYAAYIETEAKNENIDLFIDWIVSSQGQKLISETGYVPISK